MQNLCHCGKPLPGSIPYSTCEEKPDITYTKNEGFYSCIESSAHSGYRKYIVEIEQVTGQDNLYIIANFHNTGHNEFLYDELSDDSLYIRNQVISTLIVSGKGRIYDGFKEIDLVYETDDGVPELDY